jgi:hypothetical protein
MTPPKRAGAARSALRYAAYAGHSKAPPSPSMIFMRRRPGGPPVDRRGAAADAPCAQGGALCAQSGAHRRGQALRVLCSADKGHPRWDSSHTPRAGRADARQGWRGGGRHGRRGLDCAARGRALRAVRARARGKGNVRPVFQSVRGVWGDVGFPVCTGCVGRCDLSESDLCGARARGGGGGITHLLDLCTECLFAQRETASKIERNGA